MKIIEDIGMMMGLATGLALQNSIRDIDFINLLVAMGKTNDSEEKIVKSI
jgi:hypothetical protein